jgi:excisionase family DNA binding protein
MTAHNPMSPDAHSPSRGPHSPQPMMTYQEAADLLVISPRTLQRAASTGDLPVIRFGHRTVRIRREDLDAWIASKQVTINNK